MKPNDDQSRVIEGLSTFLTTSAGNDFKTLAGSAGTGKTFCMKEVRKRVEEEGLEIVFTAPTNKATKVLRQATGAECITTYSLLGLQLMPSGEIKELKQNDRRPPPISGYDAAAVDEGSMVSYKLMDYLKQASQKYHVPLIFLGDRCQLPPVGEEFSPLWENPPDYELTKVMRFDNQILRLATSLRDYVSFPIGNLKLEDDNDGNEGVWRRSMEATLKKAKQQAVSGAFRSGQAKFIAWRNKEVDFLNSELREALGTQDLSLPFSKDDRVIARSPCIGKDRETILHTDDECLVTNTIVAKHPMYPEYECFVVDLETEDGGSVAVWCVTPRSKPFLDQELKRMAEDAHKNPKNWKAFWALKEAFHDISLAYAITAHRSQGSTYEDVYVNFADILANPRRVEAAKCLYVAASRPSKRLILGG